MNREIAVKTLTGRGKLNYVFEKKINLENNISKTLGCWIINLNYETKIKDENLYLEGYYSIQLWYAKDNDQSSSVYEEKIPFCEKVMMVYRNIPTLNNDRFVKVFVNQYPSATQMRLTENQEVIIKIEALYFVDVFQEAILVIETKDNAKPDLTLDEELLMNVNPNYITESKK